MIESYPTFLPKFACASLQTDDCGGDKHGLPYIMQKYFSSRTKISFEAGDQGIWFLIALAFFSVWNIKNFL